MDHPPPSFQPPSSFSPPPRIILAETTHNQAISSPSPPVVLASSKRTFSALDHDDVSENDMVRIDKNCDQVRRMINTLIDSGEMKVKDFCNAIEVSSNAYYRFMGQSGPHKGSQSDTYIGALKFFQNRERKHIPLPKKKAKTAASAGVSAGASSAAAVGLPDISDITLEGELEDAVPVYDTCDEVRRNINAHLKKPGVTQASFLRDLMAQYHTQNRKIAASYLHRFRGNKGPDAGNTNPVFYAGYVFFEKLRIKEGKKKSKDRETMEQLYAGRGMDTTRPSGNVYYTMPKGASLTKDKFGGVSIAGKPAHYR